MKRDVTKPILQVNGKPLMERDVGDDGKDILGEDGKPKMVPITLRTVLLGALQSTVAAERSADTAAKKAKSIARIELARTVFKCDVVDFTADQLADCEALITENFVPLVVAEAHRLLNTDYVPAVREVVRHEASINE